MILRQSEQLQTKESTRPGAERGWGVGEGVRGDDVDGFGRQWGEGKGTSGRIFKARLTKANCTALQKQEAVASSSLE